MPNFNSFILFGMVSTTCSFTDSTSAMVDCILLVATDQRARERFWDGITAAWVQLIKQKEMIQCMSYSCFGQVPQLNKYRDP